MHKRLSDYTKKQPNKVRSCQLEYTQMEYFAKLQNINFTYFNVSPQGFTTNQRKYKYLPEMKNKRIRKARSTRLLRGKGN